MQNMDVNELIVHLAHYNVVISLFSSPVGAKATENIILNKCMFWRDVVILTGDYIESWNSLEGRGPFFAPGAASSALKSWAKRGMEDCNRPTTVSFSGSLFLYSHPAMLYRILISLKILQQHRNISFLDTVPA